VNSLRTRGATLASGSSAARHDLANLLGAGATISPRVASTSNLQQSTSATIDLFFDTAVGDPFTDADEHGENLALKIIFKAVIEV
jgi:hypothetical protein